MALPGERPELNVVAPQPQAPAAQPPRRRRAPHGHEQGERLALLLPGGHLPGALAHPGRARSSPRWGSPGCSPPQTPLYEADILLQVEPQPQNSSLTMGANIEGALSGPQSRVPTEIEVMQSRRLLGSRGGRPAPRRLGVAPVLPQGRAAPSPYRRGGTASHRRSSGSTRYAWGGERIKVTRFDVPAELEDSSISLTLVARDGAASFDLVERARGRSSPSGTVGKPLTWNMATPDGRRHGHPLRAGARRPARAPSSTCARSPGRQAAEGPGAAPSSSPRRGKFTGLIRVSMTSGSTPARRRGPQHPRPGLPPPQRGEALRRGRADAPVPRHADPDPPRQPARPPRRRWSTTGRGGRRPAWTSPLATTSTLERSVDLEKRLSEMELQRKELLYRFTATHPVLQALNEKVASAPRRAGRAQRADLRSSPRPSRVAPAAAAT